MKKQILLLQSYANPEESEFELQSFYRATGGLADIKSITTLDARAVWDKPSEMLEGYDAVIIGGSSEFDFDGGRPADDPVLAGSRAILERLRPLVEYILIHQTPCFGVCFGHQLIGAVKGAKVVRDVSQSKFGSFPVLLTADGKADRVFKDVPETFIAQYWHKDSLSSMPEDSVLIGSGDQCRFSILRYGSNCYTTQFHPELTMEDTKEEYLKSPEIFPQNVNSEDFIKPSPEASTILQKFVESL